MWKWWKDFWSTPENDCKLCGEPCGTVFVVHFQCFQDQQERIEAAKQVRIENLKAAIRSAQEATNGHPAAKG